MADISKKWLRIKPLYEHFAQEWKEVCDFSHEAMHAMYNYESTGKPRVSYSDKQSNGLYNGFAVGKHWWDVTLAMWIEDIRKGLISKYEIVNDASFEDFLPIIKEAINYQEESTA